MTAAEHVANVDGQHDEMPTTADCPGCASTVYVERVTEAEPVCDGPACYLATPALLFERGLITADELPTTESAVIHRSPCAVVKSLVA